MLPRLFPRSKRSASLVPAQTGGCPMRRDTTLVLVCCKSTYELRRSLALPAEAELPGHDTKDQAVEWSG